MPIRNACVARGAVPAGVNAHIYTVPAENVLLLKSLLVTCASSDDATWSAALVNVEGNIYVTLGAGEVTQSTPVVLETWVALNAGDTIYLNSAGGPSNYWVSGAVLPFDASL